MTEYAPLIERFMAAMANVGDGASSPELIAEVIWTAATDGTDTMRYRAGADAEQILTARANSTDEEMKALISARFDL